MIPFVLVLAVGTLINAIPDSNWLMANVSIMVVSMVALPAVFLGAYSSKLIQGLLKDGKENTEEAVNWKPRNNAKTNGNKVFSQ